MTEETDRYTYRVVWSEEDGEYVGTCAEFGLLSHLDDTPEKALAGIRDLVAFSVSDLRREGGARSLSRSPPAGTVERSRCVSRLRPTAPLRWTQQKPASA